MTALIVIAKETVTGKVKTRLHPPLSLEQAATLAAASLDDTFAAMVAVPATRRILAFEGTALPPGAENYEVVHQVPGGLDLRLGAIFDECNGPAALIGMDTPQLTARHLAPVFEDWPDGVDAWFGPASDGGFWALALNRPGNMSPRGELIRGIPMSRSDTGSLLLRRLRDAGLRVGLLPTLRDVDTIEDARAVASLVPQGRFAWTLDGFELGAHEMSAA